MSKELINQLSKLKLPMNKVDDVTYVIHNSSIDKTLKVGYYYIIQLEKYIIYEPEGYTLSANWNNGVCPQSEYMKCQVINIQGKMVQINGCGYAYFDSKDLSDKYYGLWLPEKSITIIKDMQEEVSLV